LWYTLVRRGKNVKAPDTLPPNYRRNFTAFLVDYVSFGIAFTLIDVNAVMPAFVGQLTDSAPVIGLVNTVFAGGWLLPQLAAARYVSDKPHKKPYMLAGLGGRIFLGVTALALWVGLSRFPTAMLILFFVCLGLFAASDGFTSVSWFDILGRAIPLRGRGRLVGTGQFIVGLAGVGIGALVGLILDRCPFPSDYALLFTLAALALVPSIVALVLIREPSPENDDPETHVQTKGGWLQLLSDDPAFRRLMVCRMLIGMMGLATSFYVKHADQELGLPQSVIGDFVAAQTLTRIISSLGLGLISERWGPQHVIRVSSAVAVMGPLFALVVHLTGGGGRLAQAYPLVYVAVGIVPSAMMLGFFNYLLEIAPEGMRPTYIGLSNTIMGALTFVPMMGGWLLEATSYTVLFGVTTAFVAASFLLSLRLQPPPEG
jgi:MFS family permease